MSRKLTYVSGLLMCFSCEFDKQAIASTGDEGASPLYDFVEHLWAYSQKTPLEIVAQTLLLFPDLETVARDLFSTYNEFLELLNDQAKRDHLEKLERDQVKGDDIYQDVRELGHKFQGALTKLFLEENGTPLFQLTKTYGVF